MFGLVIGPVSFYLLGPVTVALPGIKAWIDAAASGAWRWCCGDPLAVLLPAVRVIGSVDHLVGSVLGVRLFVRVIVLAGEFAGPASLFAFLHIELLYPSFAGIVRLLTRDAQELSHSAAGVFPYYYQVFISCFT